MADQPILPFAIRPEKRHATATKTIRSSLAGLFDAPPNTLLLLLAQLTRGSQGLNRNYAGIADGSSAGFSVQKNCHWFFKPMATFHKKQLVV